MSFHINVNPLIKYLKKDLFKQYNQPGIAG